MEDELKKVSARFYRSEHGAEPVRDWLLHGFIKKAKKTAKADLEIARTRQKEIER